MEEANTLPQKSITFRSTSYAALLQRYTFFIFQDRRMPFRHHAEISHRNNGPEEVGRTLEHEDASEAKATCCAKPQR